MADDDPAGGGGAGGGSVWDTFSHGKVGKVPVWVIMGVVVVGGAYIIAKRRQNTSAANTASPVDAAASGQSSIPYAGGDTFLTVVTGQPPGNSTGSGGTTATSGTGHIIATPPMPTSRQLHAAELSMVPLVYTPPPLTTTQTTITRGGQPIPQPPAGWSWTAHPMVLTQ